MKRYLQSKNDLKNLYQFHHFVRIAAPEGTTHFKMVMEATELDSGAETSTFESDKTTILPYDSANTYNTLTVIDIDTV